MRVAALLALATLVAASCGGVAQPSPTPTPSPTAPPSPTPTATPSPTPSPVGRLDRSVVYMARDLLPPVALHVDGAGVGSTAADRVGSRLQALRTATPGPGQFNVLPTIKAQLAEVRVQGDLATIDYAVPNDDWGGAGSAGIRAFVQQTVYTASEEPGVRRVLITQNGGKTAIIGGEGLVIDAPATRERVAGYSEPADASPIASEEQVLATSLTTTYSVDSFAPGLARFVVKALPTTPTTRFFPTFNASIRENDEGSSPDLAKWVLVLDVPGGTDTTTGDQVIDRTPLRSFRAAPLEAAGGTRYELGLDDLRPWRVGVVFDPVRIVVDVGGHPAAIAGNDVVYRPVPNAVVPRVFSVSGFARAFEANVVYRLRDGTGREIAFDNTTATVGTSAVWGAFELELTVPAGVTGAITLEILQLSPRDGSETDVVRLSLHLRS